MLSGLRYEAVAHEARLRAHVASVVFIERYVVSGDRVAAIGRTCGHVVATGRQFDVPRVHFFVIEDSMIARLEVLVAVRLMRAALV